MQGTRAGLHRPRTGCWLLLAFVLLAAAPPASADEEPLPPDTEFFTNRESTQCEDAAIFLGRLVEERPEIVLRTVYPLEDAQARERFKALIERADVKAATTPAFHVRAYTPRRSHSRHSRVPPPEFLQAGDRAQTLTPAPRARRVPTMKSRRVYTSDDAPKCRRCQRLVTACRCKQPKQATVPSDGIVRIGRETKGRKGKGVTTITGVPLTGDALKKLAKKLKAQCGAGGALKDGVIEIQGEHRDALVAALERAGYSVKRVGG